MNQPQQQQQLVGSLQPMQQLPPHLLTHFNSVNQQQRTAGVATPTTMYVQSRVDGYTAQPPQQPPTGIVGIVPYMVQQPTQQLSGPPLGVTPIAPPPFQSAADPAAQLLATGARWAQPLHQQQPSQAPLADILGIADKAASAVQALTANAAFQKQHSGHTSGYQDMLSNGQQNATIQQQPMATIVTERNLPVMVGYAVQNLKATGHIDGQLDPDLCRTIKLIPEHQALQALEKFSSCDVSVMRNKAAYLSGILRKYQR